MKLSDGLFPVVPFSDKAESLEIKRSGSLSGFYQAYLAGFDVSLPKVTIQDGMEIQREYLDGGLEPVDKVRNGEGVTVRIRVRTIKDRGEINNVALVDLLPGGFEVVIDSIRNSEGQNQKSTFSPDSVDIREDRVIVFGRVNNSMSEYFYRIKATNSGSYVVPPPFVEAMYDRTLKARGLAAKMTVGP